MSTYKLSYFDAAGRAEPVRQAFALCGVEYEDYRFKGPEFGSLKATFPYGCVPVLEVKKDGKSVVIAETIAILDYITRAHGSASGLLRTDLLENARVMEILSVCMDWIGKIAATMREPEEKKLAMRKEMADTTLPEFLSRLEARIQPSGYTVGNSLTCADLCIAQLYGWLSIGILDGIPATVVEPFSVIKKVVENVNTHPALVAYKAAQEAAKK